MTAGAISRLAVLGIHASRSTGTQRSTCPQCSSERRKKNVKCLSITFDADGAVFCCHHCGWSGCVRDGGADLPRIRHLIPKPKAPDDEAGRIAWALKLWDEARYPRQTLVERYLNSRKIELGDDLAGAVIRYHPRLFIPKCLRTEPEHDEPGPGMICLMRDIRCDRPVAVHRTFLTAAGQKRIKERAMLGRASHGAVQFDPEPTYGLGIAEGVETALSARSRYRPCWALGCEGAIRRLQPIPGIECLVIFGDSDANETGQDAARECARRWKEAGVEVVIRTVDDVGDFNDLDMRQA